MPQPLIKFDEQGPYGVFPFNADSLAMHFHLAIISKPYVPLIANIKTLGEEYTYKDGTGMFPKNYLKRNLLDYYVNRNLAVIQFLQNQPWISTKALVVAGHSEGSTIAAKLASVNPKITHLIYSGGNPMERIVTVIEQLRAAETDSNGYAEEQFKTWKTVVSDPDNMNNLQGDTYKATYEFSMPPLHYLEKLEIPILVTYGTKDAGAPFNDCLRIEMIRQKKKNFTFRALIGTEHNYFPVKSNGQIDYNTFNWVKVAQDWNKWLMENR